MDRGRCDPHVRAVLAVVGALYEDAYSVLMDCLVARGGRMRESDLAEALRLHDKDVRAIVSRLANDGLLTRQIAPSKHEPEVLNELGRAGPAWTHVTTDSFVSVDFDRFALVVRYRVAVMIKSLVVVDESKQKYVCTNQRCPDAGKQLSLFDLVFNAPVTRSLQCPRKQCGGAPVRSLAGPSGMTAAEADETKRRINVCFAPLLRLINEGEAFLRDSRTSPDLTPAGRQFAGAALVPPPPPPASSSSAAAATVRSEPQRREAMVPEFIKFNRRAPPGLAVESSSKRARVADPEPSQAQPLVDTAVEQEELRKLAQWEAAAARAWEADGPRWSVNGVSYSAAELTDDLVALMEPDEAARYAKWYQEDDFVFDQ